MSLFFTTPLLVIIIILVIGFLVALISPAGTQKAGADSVRL